MTKPAKKKGKKAGASPDPKSPPISWNSPSSSSENAAGDGPLSENTVPATLDDVVGMLNRQDKKLDAQGRALQELTEKFVILENSQSSTLDLVEDNKQDIITLKQRLDIMEAALRSLTDENKFLRNKLHAGERRSREWGVRVYGVPQSKDENIRNVVSKIIVDNKLHDVGSIQEADQLIEHCHRLPVQRGEGTASNRHAGIIINFFSRVVRNNILKTAKRSLNRNNSGVAMVEDLTREDHALKRAARHQMKEAHALGKQTSFYRGKLYINSVVVPIKAPPKDNK